MAYNSQDSDLQTVLSAFLAALTLGLVFLGVFVVAPRVLNQQHQGQEAHVTQVSAEDSPSMDETIQEIGAQKQEEERRRAEEAAAQAAQKEEERKAQEAAQAAALAEVSDGDYVLPDSSTHYYTREELAGLSAEELMIARNEIFARHGREFNSADLRSYFSSKSWYHAQYSAEEFDAMPSPLSDCERANIELIMSIEAGA